MNPAPTRVGNALVIAFSPIDHRHRPTGACRHTVAGVLQGPAAGLAICKYETSPGYYLFYCDADWNSITDTYHDTVEAAMSQAEFEYGGVSGTWQQTRQD
jgi:hypothetical protein